MKKILAFAAAIIMAVSVFTGCGKEETASISGNGELFATSQEVRESPEWVTKLDAAKDAEQLIVVAGYDKNTAYISMHEKQNGKWMKIISTPGFIGLDGLGKANINEALTPVGTYTIDKAFGIANDPCCQMEYT
ncbi:MAG: hypothetical protein IJM06_01055, partial [Firmicutes bacterium]|nr:hypothetical protein [Bacillota bacterium]